jgi:hypothetical protein
MSSLKIAIAFLLTALAAGAVMTEDSFDITVVQINSKWNQSNSLDINKLEGCKKVNANLEDQPFSVQRKLPNVPVIIVYKGEMNLATFGGNIMLEPTVSLEKIQEIIDEAKQ